jgi:hypothetical protein
MSKCYSCRILIKLELAGQVFGAGGDQILSFVKIRLVEAELFHAGGHGTDLNTLYRAVDLTREYLVNPVV